MRFLLPIPFIQWIAGTQTSCCVRAFSANLDERKAVHGFVKDPRDLACQRFG
jgi:hypothetical protein